MPVYKKTFLLLREWKASELFEMEGMRSWISHCVLHTVLLKDANAILKCRHANMMDHGRCEGFKHKSGLRRSHRTDNNRCFCKTVNRRQYPVTWRRVSWHISARFSEKIPASVFRQPRNWLLPKFNITGSIGTDFGNGGGGGGVYPPKDASLCPRMWNSPQHLYENFKPRNAAIPVGLHKDYSYWRWHFHEYLHKGERFRHVEIGMECCTSRSKQWVIDKCEVRDGMYLE